jgi:aldehyde dehydrogenase (NAD(P)+)
MHNAGFNCIAAQVLVLPEEWNRTPALIAAIEDVLRTLPDRPAYYPGAADRCARLTTHADVRRYGGAATGFTPRSLVFADPEADDPIFRNEVFGSALAVVQIPGDIDTYLRRATAFANERLWGTLGANLIADPRTLRTHESAVDQAIADLRYGCVAVNAWTGVGYFLNETPWGAFPGHTLEDIGSGIGVVHNSHLFSRSQKSVVYAPFLQFPKPPWFVTNRQAAGIGKALCGFEVNKNPLTAAKIAMLAMSG